VQSIQAHESANLMANADVWDSGFVQGKFATITCPAWMMGKIQDEAKGTAGKWDVAPVPGRGGNWGGSYLTVPKQGGHLAEAADLAAWLTAPEQQAYVFTTHGSLPSIPALYDHPKIVNFRSGFFHDAPVGRMFTAGAKSLTPQYQGRHAGEIQIIIRDALMRIENGTQAPEASWRQMLADVGKLP
jgi:cellobiose transport system substrate-binding protein